jgi:hypothetical protein
MRSTTSEINRSIYAIPKRDAMTALSKGMLLKLLTSMQHFSNQPEQTE